MARTTDNVIRIIKAGGVVSIDAQGRTTDNMLRIIKEAQKKGTKITIRNLNKHTTDNIIRLVKAGKEFVVFEV